MTTINKVRQAIERIKQGYSSEYISCENEQGESLRIRVANHPCNPSRMNSQDISIVVEGCELEDGLELGGYNYNISKKSFSKFHNEYSYDSESDILDCQFYLDEFLSREEIV